MLSNALYMLSYVLGIVYAFELGSKWLFPTDTLHLGLVLHFIAAFYKDGGSWGGKRLWKKMIQFFSVPGRYFIVSFLIAALYGTLALIRHYGFYTEDLDFGIFAQLIKNLAAGRGYYSSFGPDGHPTFLADHQSYTFVLLAPLFWTPIGSELVLYAQAFCFYVPSAYFASKIKKEQGPEWGLLFFLAWVLFSPLAINTFWDLHETIFSFPLLALFMWGLLRNEMVPLFIGAIGAALSKEHLGALMLPCVLFVGFKSRVHYFLMVLLVGILWFDRQLSVSQYFGRYVYLGSSYIEVIRNLFFQPKLWVSTLVEWSRVHFLLEIVSPLLLGTFFAGRYSLLFFPFFLCHALSTRHHQQSTHFHYVLEIFPVALMLAWVGWQRMEKQLKGWLKPALLFSILWNLPRSPYGELKTWMPHLAECMQVRSEMRGELIELNQSCSKIYGVAGTDLYSQVFDLGEVFTARPASDIPNRPTDEGKLRTSEFLETFQSSRCRFILANSFEVRRFLGEVSGREQHYQKIRSWSHSCPNYRTGVISELWVGSK